MGLWIITLTDPGFSIPSLPEGMILPVPIIVMGTTGTSVFAAILNAPFCESTNVEWNQTGKRETEQGENKRNRPSLAKKILEEMNLNFTQMEKIYNFYW